MLLNEILDTKVDYKVVRADAHMFTTRATINGRQIDFECSSSKTGDKDVWRAFFVETNPDDPEDYTFKTSGSGGELEVFAMVRDSLLDFVKRYKPEVISFTADKDGGKHKTARGDVYERMIKRAKIPEYTYTRTPEGNGADIFNLTRKEK